MLPTLAPPLRAATDSDIAASACPDRPQAPCQSRALRRRFALSWTAATSQHAAAAWCDRCPLATACLVDALRLHAARARGEDPYGISGVCGGVWFEPGRPPQRVPHSPVIA